MNTLLSATYLGPIEHYAHLYRGSALIEQWEHYNRQTYANRCYILSAGGPLPLIIPTEKTTPHTPIKEIRISTHSDWQTLHWRAIESAYRTSPFFEYYQDDLLPLYQKKWNFLIDFDTTLQDTILHTLDLPSPTLTSQYQQQYTSTLDLRGRIHPKHSSSPTSAFHVVPYYQVFQNKYGFTSNLSIIDLLFNMGNETRIILKQSITA